VQQRSTRYGQHNRDGGRDKALGVDKVDSKWNWTKSKRTTFPDWLRQSGSRQYKDENQEQDNDKVRNVPLAFLSMEKLRSTRSSRRRIERWVDEGRECSAWICRGRCNKVKLSCRQTLKSNVSVRERDKLFWLKVRELASKILMAPQGRKVKLNGRGQSRWRWRRDWGWRLEVVAERRGCKRLIQLRGWKLPRG